MKKKEPELLFPKQPKRRKRMKHKNSILQEKNGICFLCALLDGDMRQQYGLHKHHVFFGAANRKLSEEAEVLEAKTPSALVGGDEVLTMLVKNAYASFFGAFAADLAAHFHISEIVEEKMNAMPPEDLEELVLSVMKKELNIVIWLGGVIGFVLGIINTLISFF